MGGYLDRRPLGARVSLYDYQVGRVDLPGEALRLLGTPSGPIVDVGCGLGQYVDRLTTAGIAAYGLDESPAMARDVRGETTRLPFASGSCAAALAMHMLYHVADIPSAVRELRRVVRPGGTVLASANGAEDKRSLYALLGPGREVALKLGARFSLDHAGLLREAFDQVELQTWEREIVVPTPEPIEAYVASTGADPEVREQAAAQVREVIARNGAFRTTSVVGIFVCQ